LIDVSDVLSAYASDNEQKVEGAAKSLRTDAVDMDREDLKAEIGARRHTTLVTSWMPESWVASCYPSGYFGLERNPDWTSESVKGIARSDSSAGRTAAV
jgi:hypothetical protein